MSQKTVGDKTRTRGKAASVTVAQSSTQGPQPASSTSQSTGSLCKMSDKGDITPGLGDAVAKILATLERMEARLDRLDGNISEVRQATIEIKQETAESRRKGEEDRRNLQIAVHKMTLTEIANRRMANQINDMENRSRVCNIRIDGKPEDNTENLLRYVTDLASFLNPTEPEQSRILSVYRVGKKQGTEANQHRRGWAVIRPRTVLITFKSVYDRNMFYFARTKLKGSDQYKGIFLNDDVSPQTRKMRDDFRSVAVLARDSGREVRVHGDGVIIDGRKYKITEPETLPDQFSLAKAKTVEHGGELYFHSEHSFLSNFHPAPIVDGTATYPTAEHRFQAAKCAVAGDWARHKMVLQALTPLEAKRIADQIPETAEWRRTRDGVLETVIAEKFDQNPHLADLLVKTGDLPLNEATNNIYYGIGATLHSREIKDKGYKGLNKLGHILAAKRKDIKEARLNKE